MTTNISNSYEEYSDLLINKYQVSVSKIDSLKLNQEILFDSMLIGKSFNLAGIEIIDNISVHFSLIDSNYAKKQYRILFPSLVKSKNNKFKLFN